MTKKVRIQIKHWLSGSVLFEWEGEENSLKETLSDAVLSGADLSGADLSGAVLSGADLRDAVLSGAVLRDADLRDADLRDADLRGADLSDADLSDADLSGADLRDADLSGAVLSDADLRGAVLRGADLSGADLSGADLSGADLSGADLRDADLRDADLRGADLMPIKADIWELLLHAIPEIPALRHAIIDGKVDGSVYSGECACLCGTIANVRTCDYREMKGITPDSSRPAERFFMGVSKGDTPETNAVSKIVLEWIDELLSLIQPKPVKRSKSSK